MKKVAWKTKKVTYTITVENRHPTSKKKNFEFMEGTVAVHRPSKAEDARRIFAFETNHLMNDTTGKLFGAVTMITDYGNTEEISIYRTKEL